MKSRDKNPERGKPSRPTGPASGRISHFASRLFDSWHKLELPLTARKLVVAVSGGADSVALLLALDELIKKQRLRVQLVVAHLDHGLRRESREDARWVVNLASQLGHESVASRVNVQKRATTTADNLEQAARRARYEFFAKTARKRDAQMILTAHTMDDQAETVMLRLLRGSGAEGLAGIEPVRAFDQRSDLQLVRPLLTWARRSDTESHCRQRLIDFRTDAMNLDEQFARVRVRRQLIPMMESFNGRIVEALARTAELLRDDLSVLNQQAEFLLLAATEAVPQNKVETKAPPLNVRVLADAPPAVRRRALRKWIAAGRGDLRRLELVHINGVENLLAGNRGGRTAELPGGDTVVRKQQWLWFVAQKPTPR